MTASPSAMKRSTRAAFWPSSATARPNSAEKRISGSRCSRDSSSGKSLTVRADTMASPRSTPSPAAPPGMVPPWPRIRVKGFHADMKPKENTPVTSDMHRKTPSAVTRTLPTAPLFCITVREWATEKNTSGTTSTKTRFRNSVPGARSTRAPSPSVTPSTPPTTRPSSSRSVAP